MADPAEHPSGSPDRCDWIEAGQPYPNECGRTLPCDRHSTDAEGHPFGFTNLAQEHPSGSPQTERGLRLLDDLRSLIPPGLWTAFREEQIAASIAATEAAARREPLDVDEDLLMLALDWAGISDSDLIAKRAAGEYRRLAALSSIPAREEDSDD